MMDCWAYEREQRPMFKVLGKQLKSFLQPEFAKHC